MNNPIRDLIEEFVHKITVVIDDSIRERLLFVAEMTRAPAQMTQPMKVGPSSPPIPQRLGKVRKTGLAASRAAAKKVSDAAVLVAIAKVGKKGILAKDLAKAVGLVPGALAYRLGKLRAARKVKSTGKTSKMRYFLAGK